MDNALWLLLLLASLGCQPAAAPPKKSASAAQPEQSEPSKKSANSSTAAKTGILVDDSWEVNYIKDQRVGYQHTRTEEFPNPNGGSIFRTVQNARMKIVRFNDPTVIEVESKTFERSAGQLYAMESAMKVAQNEQRITGKLTDAGKFQLVRFTLGKSETHELDWADDVLGPYAPVLQLREQPLKPGEKRTLKVFLPEFNLVTVATLEANDWEMTPVLGDRQRKLLKVTQTNILPNQTMTLTMWLDEAGIIQKSVLPMGELQVISYRTDATEALGPTGNVDLGEQTMVKLTAPIAKAHERSHVAYEVTSSNPDALAAFPSGSYQTATLSDGKLRLENRRRVPDADRRKVDPQIDPQFTQPNNFIQSDHAAIVARAKAMADRTDDPWERCVQLEKWVSENMQKSDFTIGFATAAEVMETRQGDCTEHGVLLAALCRAAGVPARVAMGLVYVDRHQAFVYHLWTEVGLGGEWYALDGTLGQGSVGPAHLKLGDASLAGASALSTMLPILKVIGNLRIKALEVE